MPEPSGSWPMKLPVISTPFSGALDYILEDDKLIDAKKNNSIQIINQYNSKLFSLPELHLAFS